MVESTYVAFPREGVELLVSAEDALAYGINPGDPAVVEVTVRSHTVEEWITEASDGTFEALDEQADVPESESDPIASGEVEHHPMIRWRSAAEPMAGTGGEEPTRIRWESGSLAG
jgi:hypothetical protein